MMATIAALSGSASFAQAVTTCARRGQARTLLCVSSCVPASQNPCKDWRREGDSNPTVLPVNKGESHGDSRIDSRNSIPSCPDLTQVVTAWAKLSIANQSRHPRPCQDGKLILYRPSWALNITFLLGAVTIEFNALAGREFGLAALRRSPLWKNVLARLATGTAAIWA